MALDQTHPALGAHGEAKLALYVNGERDSIDLAVSSSWYTEDGQLREGSLQLRGDTKEAYDLLNEAFVWLWKRWKRPIAEVGPFSS